MINVARNCFDVIRRTWIRLQSFLGVTNGGLATEGVILLLSNIRSKWFRWSTWKKARKRRAFKALVRKSVATAAVCAVLALSFFLKEHRDSDRSLHGKIETLEVQNRDFARELNELRSRAGKEQSKPSTAVKVRDAKSRIRQQTLCKVQELFGDITSYSSTLDISRPPLVLSSMSADVTQKSMAEQGRFEGNAVLDFLKLYGGPLYEVKKRCRELGIDTSRLEGHLSTLRGTVMFRVIANDLQDIAEELEQRKAGKKDPSTTARSRSLTQDRSHPSWLAAPEATAENK